MASIGADMVRYTCIHIVGREDGLVRIVMEVLLCNVVGIPFSVIDSMKLFLCVDDVDGVEC